MLKKYIILILLIVLVLLFWIVCPKRIVPVNNNSQNVIYIDPGHGGPDGGTVSRNGIYEKDIVLIISYYLKNLFEGNGYIVYMTRLGDYDLASQNSQNRKREDIRQRVKLINESPAILYLSVHANSYPSEIVYGAQTFYQSSNSRSQSLAICIQESIKSSLKNTKREALLINDKFLIDNVKKTGCLVEVGFLSNPRELALLQAEEYQIKMATAIYVGVLDYLENHI